MHRAPRNERYLLGTSLPFIAAHLACFAAIWTGVSVADLALCAGLYAARMFGVTGGYHRYFSHKTYKTSRVMAFILGFLAQSSAQRGILWWAGTHRHHHRFSDGPEDVHSPVRRSFVYSHVGWIFSDRYDTTDLSLVPDLAKYPELLWLERHPYLPALISGFVVWLLAGWSGLVVGFMWSTVLCWHATFAINSLAHVHGKRRYVTGDQSRNNWWLALLTFGEGWHNNHHHYQGSARQGFRWYEIDISYYVLRAMSAVGLVWDLRLPSERAIQYEQKLTPAVVEKAAGQLAASFKVESIAADLRTRLTEKRGHVQHEMSELIDRWHRQLDEKVDHLRHDLDELFHAIHVPTMPSATELREKAASMFAHTPSINDIVERTRQMLMDGVRDELLGRQAAGSHA
ncbi:acyl-CoA desaturase [Emcibacter sp. SYSU 3D8]|uniref:acyl-CoA desaturase n=1 Tax=Emcibacter sp. SYSU 3D8 TaxID=3133969 RepID=UPI0031FE64E7